MNKLNLPQKRMLDTSKSRLSMLLLTLVLLLSGCSSDMDYLSNSNSNAIATATNKNSNITKDDAIAIANSVLKKKGTRSCILDLPSFEYVVGGNSTRSTSTADTLAYVLNYPDNAGFVIVAADRRVYPVLGFANEGTISQLKENGNENEKFLSTFIRFNSTRNE